MSVPVIDLFAGPGGLGEGFSAVRDTKGRRIFDIRVSIEKDAIAHRTLTLRAMFRALSEHGVPDAYYDYVRGDIDRPTLMSDPTVASVLKSVNQEAHCLELGGAPESQIDDLIRAGINGNSEWVLIGGPPCQAYSLAGRSRRKNVDPSFEQDPKHLLYREYLRIIRDFQPAVFVMENVKGMLSSTHDGQRIFERILGDLSEPAPGVHYDIRSFTTASRPEGLDPADFLIRAEDYGVPQMRHRVILLGIRSDHASRNHELLTRFRENVTVRSVLADLPALRSKLSRQPDSHETWLKILNSAPNTLGGWRCETRDHIKHRMEEAACLARHVNQTGGQFLENDVPFFPGLPTDLAAWYRDDRLGGVCQHETRSHMASDLHRYLFASSFARQQQYSPKLDTFPPKLLPAHGNVGDENIPFDDRFRVQIADSPSTTIVSHIAKDGHYYIHPDPSQCRSLTVREAARLQTFPDNYFFEGNRTQQYHQVGNAVPPFLAKQLGESVARFLKIPVCVDSQIRQSEGKVVTGS
ncbi:DNA cytosine methyltransferase [Burkholderia contaminans]|jgi:DNA (cytosine-5)-methyltransferase 1|uniref:DNA (cytosine-5-)-methyltransferase n=2 Tax=Burkholderia contaminans TaxID=488447 RepID=A0AAP1VFE0_9BURK|nr:DNA cytosine methyltransferase [Burkholderia contaminans]MBA9831714.1 DNA cytosine methyltransferase [Burkholderia contaminans]MBA9843389.1 DNA cytosine methyltransferase [Burkholderia contaminans]MBA9868073.1 DNA cytosine methyltransferase [Burkholderia contaminans]MBA9910761.1 DNA cytosine methyltransferase [Burkholderia contaminans]MBA9931421.1 DNA cytosine methyltransferase [Burkholderia contaminans]